MKLMTQLDEAENEAEIVLIYSIRNFVCSARKSLRTHLRIDLFFLLCFSYYLSKSRGDGEGEKQVGHNGKNVARMHLMVCSAFDGGRRGW